MNEMIVTWFSAHQATVWLFIALMGLLFEVGSPGLFFFLSFFFGALLAAGSAFTTQMWLVQSVVFLIGSVIAFIALTRWVKRRVLVEQAYTLTNVYAMRSKKGIVVKKITAETMGLVKVGGELWSARSHNQKEIEKGAQVVVVRIKGAHLVVQKVSTS